ncbi:hypothetical protein BCR36DRAFT_417183 [Piromyces finnis]|uniref:Adenylyl cyclase n=1 Tax=Piromyces finnis TaxID=1754191 RepID=A0A1Y1UBY0_9FUNG|nr:hypothetical protein BCR36DRAFT_417183 [Piromyces finnis]|eukprot:ORX35512.1 hypothetical protein BCR36DRAFT_417183 [Piromyces finnis]
MNGYLDMLIDVITSYGGDLIKFAGDAVIFCWTYDLGNDIVENTDYAINFFDTGYMIINVIMCCLELIKTVNENPIYIPGYQTVTGFTYGIGNVTTQLSKLLDEANQGKLQYLIKHGNIIKGFTDEFKKHLTINNNGDGCVIIESGKIPDNIFNIDKKNLRSNSGAKEAALHKMESGISNLIEFNELRKVTTVFIRLTQIKFNSKDDLQIAQEALSAVQRILAVQEGTLRQFLYDDKGAVYYYILGNRIRSDYSVVGDSVNMAGNI